MTIQDGRDGAYGMTYKKDIINDTSLPEGLLQSCKSSLFITDSNFDEKLKLLIIEAIHDYENITSTSVFGQVITVNYEYFKGKNRLPFKPHGEVTEITDYDITGDFVKFLEGGQGEPLTVVYDAGYTPSTIPSNTKNIILKMVASKWNQEEKYPSRLYSLIRTNIDYIE